MTTILAIDHIWPRRPLGSSGSPSNSPYAFVDCDSFASTETALSAAFDQHSTLAQKRQKAKESSARRKAQYHVPEEVRDKDGLTESQRKHMDNLCSAARVNAQTGIPMEKILDPDAEFAPTEEEEAVERKQKRAAMAKLGLYDDQAGLSKGQEGPCLPPKDPEELQEEALQAANGYTNQPPEEFPTSWEDPEGNDPDLRLD